MSCSQVASNFLYMNAVRSFLHMNTDVYVRCLSGIPSTFKTLKTSSYLIRAVVVKRTLK